ncbi:MAG: WYL domain-containing transcriptional regulator [Clostridia bacterium]|nr:WYL domain-containing transcriptional regulator [Clostridia bacterium]
MASISSNKLKLLYIVKILKKYSDEEHPVSAADIISKLDAYGISAERKAIYDDIECLVEFGYEIIKTRVPKPGYFLGERDFELPEIYLLKDAVRTAHFITEKKTLDLCRKLDRFLSGYQVKNSAPGIYVNTDGKTKNESIFYNIDTITHAIDNNHKITYKYGVRELKGRDVVTVYKERKINPYATTWQDDHYYLVGNYDKYDNLVHLRIDRMKSVEETTEKSRHFSEVSSYSDSFNVADYTKRLFDMFVGNFSRIHLRCSKDTLEQIVDRFGNSIFVSNVTDKYFEISVECAVSYGLVNWIVGFSDNIEVISPEPLRTMIKERAQKVLNLYK